MISTLVTDLVTEPVSLADAKAHLRVTTTDDNDLITAIITTARTYIELITGLSLGPKTWDIYFENFKGDELYLPYAPLVSVTYVKYYDFGGTQNTWDSSNYIVDTDSIPGRVYPVYNGYWPSDSRGYEKDINVRFVSGYADADAVPNPLKHAIMMMVGELYENREISLVGATINDLPFAVKHLIAPYVVSRLGYARG